MSKEKQPREIESIYPLTYLQEGMLFHSIYGSDPEIYFEQFTCKISGNFNPSAFRSAWDEAVKRHNIFKTAFTWKTTEQMMQVVLKNSELPFVFLDWRSIPQTDQQQKLNNYLAEDKRSGFKLNMAPLMRLALIRLNDCDYQLIWSHHHLVMDAWSRTILLRDIFILYNALCKSEKIQLKTSRPFRDYIFWLRNQDLKKAEEFWKSYLYGFNEPTPLPFQSLCNSHNSSCDVESATLSVELTSRLNEISHEFNVTIGTILQCAWAVLLSRYCGENDIVFGITTAGRPPEFEDIESMVGLFINTIPMRVRLISDETVKAFLQRIQNEVVESREYEYVSLVQIHGCSDVRRGIPLFNTLVVYENAPFDESVSEQLQELKLSDIRVSSKTNYPLVLVALPGNQISLGIIFDQGKFNQDAVKRLSGHLLNIINTLAFYPQMYTRQLSLLNEEEKKGITTDFTGNMDNDLCPELLHNMFEKQAKALPRNVSVVYKKNSYTYQELDRKANQLANYLISKKTAIDKPIGLLIDRSADMITVILGILKSGAAYLPIDPGYPADRINYMISDSGMQYLITENKYLNKITLPSDHITCIDKEKEVISSFSNEVPDRKISADNLAYIIYTSGSTGKPKGVMVTHRGLKNILLNMGNDWKIDSNSRLMQFSSIGFDASVIEIFTALTSGAELFIASKDTITSPEKVTEFIRDNKISFVIFPPTLLALLKDENLDDLKTVVSGGELCSWEIAEKWSKHHEFFNAYGPTEITIACSWGKYESVAEKESVSFPVGKPFRNIKLYLLDNFLNPVPPDVQGEIYVSGPGVARGYLNRPDLTAETFIPDPFSGERGGRMYRTGDLVKHLMNGTIEYICRNDNQVKIRGFRIELSEIESLLLHFKGIKNAAALVKKKKSGDPYIAAYLITSENTHLSSIEIRKYLSAQLPDYMIPSEFIFLDTFPLTHSGKIDRKTLLLIDQTKEDIAGNAKPVDPTVELLKVIWKEVLEVPTPDADDGFFELGGHSLKATQMIARIRKVFRLDISLNDLFSNPTINSLARVIKKNSEQGINKAVDQQINRSAKRNNGAKEFELSFAQQRLWFLEQLSPGSSMFHIPIALRLSGKLDYDALKMSLFEIVKRHEAMRTVFLSSEGKPYQLVKEYEETGLEFFDLSNLSEDQAFLEIREMAGVEIKKIFNLAEGPLFRFKLYKSSENEHIFLIVMHHIISDGWSMTVFIQELAHYYRSFVKKENLSIPNLPVQYADFSEWQRSLFAGDILTDQLNYWRKELEGITPLLELSSDRLRPPVQTSNGAAERFTMPKEAEEKLNDYCLKEGVTPYMVLLSAFQIFLARLSDKSDIAVGSPVANRTNIDTEKMIGFFVNTLVMRYNFHGTPGFTEVVKNNREKTLLAFANQDLPFDLLVEKLQPERNMSYSPLFQIAFVYQNFTIRNFELPDVSISAFDMEISDSKYDLTLTISESEKGLIGYWEYNTDLFNQSTILRRADQFKELLINLLDHPEKNVWEVPVVSRPESKQILNDWAKSKMDYNSDVCIHQLFENIVNMYPDACAVNYSDLSGKDLISSGISYNDLNKKANRLAHQLRRMGVKAETSVGLLVPRSIDLAVVVLAVLKAGGVFIPLDPTYPRDRIHFIIEDSDTRMLLATLQLSEKFPELQDKMVIIDQYENLTETCDEENLQSNTVPDNLAYIIYTSGSTGLPKGTMLTHRGLCNIAAVQKEKFQINHDHHVLQFASASYDAFVWEFFMALLNGSEMQMISHLTASSMEDIAKVIHLIQTDVVTLPPSILLNLPVKDENGDELLNGLKIIIVAGEKCPSELANTWMDHVRFFNAYGPTEVTICASVACISKTCYDNVPIGRPNGNYELYILDKHMQPVPCGIPGELYIGGIGLARGYLMRPDLTAEKFVPSPFSFEKGSRLYRSGDLVKFSEDGNVVFLERIDTQVKIHGLRIELGEIESLLLEHPRIRQAAVRLHKDHFSEERLIAYYTLKDSEEISKEDLRDFLKKRLPEFMIPHLFVAMSEFPLTKNGKINYQALPSDEILRHEIEKQYVAPSNEIEEKLALIGMELLKIDRMGIHDNFFELGGHSLLVSRFISKIRDQFKVELPVRTVFEHPTIAELEIILKEQKSRSHSESEAPQKVSRETGDLVDLLKDLENMPESEVYKQLDREKK